MVIGGGAEREGVGESGGRKRGGRERERGKCGRWKGKKQ